MHAWVEYAYLLAAVCFIFGLKRLSSPKTARSGNAIAAVGMLVAILATLLDQQILSYWQLGVGMLIGGALGAILAKTVQMTSMPGAGGGCSTGSVALASAAGCRVPRSPATSAGTEGATSSTGSGGSGERRRRPSMR